MSLDVDGPAGKPERFLDQSRAKTGFASQPSEFAEHPLDLHELLAPHAQATYFFRAGGPLKEVVPILHDDILIIDRSEPIRDGVLVIGVDNEDFVVRRVRLKNEQCVLVAEDPTLPDIIVSDPAAIFGVITYVVHKVRRQGGDK